MTLSEKDAEIIRLNMVAKDSQSRELKTKRSLSRSLLWDASETSIAGNDVLERKLKELERVNWKLDAQNRDLEEKNIALSMENDDLKKKEHQA